MQVMKYLVGFHMDLYEGALEWDEETLRKNLSIDFSVTPFANLEQAWTYVKDDYALVARQAKRNEIDPDNYVAFGPDGWFIEDEFSLEGRTAVPGEGKGFSVWYHVDWWEGELSDQMQIDSVVEAPEGAESSFRVDREKECIVGSIVAREAVPDYGDQDDWDEDRDGFIERVREAVVAPFDGTESSPGKVIDWTQIGAYEVDGLKVLADRGDLDAKYLLVQVAFDRSDDRPPKTWLEKEEDYYLIDAFNSGSSEAILPYMNCFFRSNLFSNNQYVADSRLEWSGKGGEVVTDRYYSYHLKIVDGFIEFCRRIDKEYPESTDDCVELIIDVSEDAMQELEGMTEYNSFPEVVERNGRKVWSVPALFRYIRDLAAKLEQLPQRMLDPVREALPKDFKRIADKDADPFLGGYSLDSFIEEGAQGNIDYLFERYGLQAVERYVDSIDVSESEFEFDDDAQRERYAQMSPTMARAAERVIWQGGFFRSEPFAEDIFRYCAFEKNSGTPPDCTFCYETMAGSAEDGLLGEFRSWWQPSMFKKYGLEELTELGISILNDSQFRDDLDEWIEDDPSFMEELIPVLREYDAKGSKDARALLRRLKKRGMLDPS